MAQVSGSLSLDLSKVVRETTSAVIKELTRSTPTKEETQNGTLLPMEQVSAAVADRVSVAVSAQLSDLETKLDALTALVQAEAARSARMNPEVIAPATGEHPAIVRVPDRNAIYDPQAVMDSARAHERIAQATHDHNSTYGSQAVQDAISGHIRTQTDRDGGEDSLFEEAI